MTNPDAAPEMKVTGNTKNSSVTFRYTANEQSFNVNYVDDSTRKVVNTVPVSGKTDETVSFDAQAHVPSGYVIVSGQNIPSSFHITGDKMDDVDILVHHNYNEKYHVSLPAGEQITTHVGANENVSSLDPSKIALNWTDENGNSISEPEGTQVTWATVPDTTKIANETGNLNIKFRDGTTTSIEIPVVVQGATAGDVQKVYQNDPVPAASGSVNTSTVDHFGISSDAWSVAPSTAILGMASGTVRVNYSDGTYQDVDVYIDVIDRPKVSIPAGEQVTTHVGARADAQIMSPSLDPSNIQLTWTGAKGETIQLPAGITVVWETVPDTTKIANETGILNVKFANGSITRLGIPVIVKGAKQGEVQTVYVGDPVPSAKKAVDTTDVKNYFDISSVKWLATDTPSTAAVGNNIPGTVRVTYSDGTYQDVVVAINVISKGGGTPTTIPWTKIDPQPKPKPKPDPTPDKKPDKDDQPKQPEQKPEVEKHDGKTNKVTEKTVVQKVVKKSASASVTGKVNKPVAKQAAQKVALPQTGEKDSNLATILGSLVALVGLSVLAYADKKKRN